MRMLVAGLLLASAYAQEPPPAPPADPDPAPSSAAAPDDEAQRPPSTNRGWRRFGEQSQAPAAAPSQLILPAGSFITIRVNQALSSDTNQTGDTFTATLSQPLIADGFVVARRGQTVAGRVADAVKAGRAKGTSRLAIELNELSLVDGRQIPILTQLMEYSGGTSKGRDATAIAGTTGLGAAIGGVAAGGAAAGIGAAAGAAASVIGVLVTRGRATEIYPEAIMTFRTMQPITISTERSQSAFQPVEQGDYEPKLERRAPTLQRRAAPAWYPGYWGGYWGPTYWGPGWGSYWGPSYFGGGVIIRGGRGWGGGFHGRGRR
ncbi:MAG: hypothetical protein JST93_34200 [Acidobacteria bacterium]|nr:hypothetical protein [Acidobacteriota bacterium]